MYNTIDSVINYSSPSVSYCASCSQQPTSPQYTPTSHSIESLTGQDYSFSLSETTNYNSSQTYSSTKQSESKTYASATNFISPYASKTKFIDNAEEIKELIEEAFKATTDKELPGDIMISVCSKEKMKEINKDWHEGIEGFAINTHPKMVFVKNSDLAHVMVTMGHEIGHVLSNNLGNSRDEEAKAFAFELAWIRAIKEKNIGNLSNNLIVPEPAKNGLHDFALNFVINEVNSGINPFDLFLDLSDKTAKCL